MWDGESEIRSAHPTFFVGRIAQTVQILATRAGFGTFSIFGLAHLQYPGKAIHNMNVPAQGTHLIEGFSGL